MLASANERLRMTIIRIRTIANANERTFAHIFLTTFERFPNVAYAHMRYSVHVNANANPVTESHSNAPEGAKRSNDARIRTFVDCGSIAADASSASNGPESNDHIRSGKEVIRMAGKTYTPKVLANEIGVDPKVLRAYLRKNHTREDTAKNTSWIIPETVANAARKAFAKNVAGSAKK